VAVGIVLVGRSVAAAILEGEPKTVGRSPPQVTAAIDHGIEPRLAILEGDPKTVGRSPPQVTAAGPEPVGGRRSSKAIGSASSRRPPPVLGPSCR
jgi:hypothetical protein